jgi:NAD(P)-dependent dehydrogenase (short-subunit alcohol dehydrogenase family)
MNDTTIATRTQSEAEPRPPFAPQRQQSPGLESALDPPPRYRAPQYKPAGKLLGKAALVTGGDSGIGRAVAVLFAREGADIAIAFLPEEASDAEVTKAEIEAAGRRCVLCPGDLTDAAYCDALVLRTVNELGAIDVLVSNAAYQRRKKRLEDVTDAEFERTFQTNIYAYFRLARAALRHMKPGSAIIATSSETGIKGATELADYSATKGAINAFTKTLARNCCRGESA